MCVSNVSVFAKLCPNIFVAKLCQNIFFAKLCQNNFVAKVCQNNFVAKVCQNNFFAKVCQNNFFAKVCQNNFFAKVCQILKHLVLPLQIVLMLFFNNFFQLLWKNPSENETATARINVVTFQNALESHLMFIVYNVCV